MRDAKPVSVGQTLTIGVPDRLLSALDVDVAAFALCEIPRGVRLTGGNAAIEVHYVLAGQLHLTVGDHPPVTCGPGSVILVPAAATQAMAAGEGPWRDASASDVCEVDASGLLRLRGEGEPAELKVACGLVEAGFAGALGLFEGAPPQYCDLSDSPLIGPAMAGLLDEFAVPRSGGRALCAALMKVCLLLFLRRRTEGNGLPGAFRDPRLARAVASVLERPAASHSVAGLAAVAGMSRSAFARAFAEQFGTAPMAFVTRTRLEQGAELLRGTRLPVKRIAAMIGYASRSHFSRAFAAAYDSDPSAYRASLNEGAL